VSNALLQRLARAATSWTSTGRAQPRLNGLVLLEVRSRPPGRLPSPLVADYIFTMIRASKFYGADRKVLDDITLAFLPGAKIGVLGANGAGKSTLLRIMAGREEPSSGRAELASGATVGLLEQEPQLDPERDVRGNVEHGVGRLRDLLTRFDEISAAFSEPDADFDALMAEQGIVQEQIDRADAWSLDATIDRASDALRLPGGDRDVTTLSGGERRRVALARLLLSTPDLLLLDEPTNHLDAESVAWLERFLADYAGTVVAVTHDRYFLDNVAGWILELDRGKGIPYEGNYSGWLEQKQARLAGEEKQESARRRALARELEWVRSSPKARHAKSRARITAYQKLLDEEQNVKLDRVEIHIPAGPRLGDLVVAADGLAKSFGETLLFEDLSFSLPPGGIVGVVGPNGAGKTTLFRMIVGDEEPDAGELRVGDAVEIAYVDQARADLTPSNAVWEEISGGHDTIELGSREVNSRQYVSWFNFKGPDQQKPVGDLSGGERNRVHLAKLLRSGGNVLLLDEPTNDLDVDTLRALEDALLQFAGCAVVISHDRWFLDRIATHILAFEGDSQVTWFEGSWEEYATWAKDTRGADALEPHRIKYKPLLRPRT
jgi:energy-dependent translational throttle protein EttA